LKRERGLAVAGLLVVVLIVGLALALNPPMTRPTTSRSSSTLGESSSEQQQSSTTGKGIIVPSSSASTLDSLTGLSLNLDLSTNYDRWVIVTAYEFNTLDRANNVTHGHGWPADNYLLQWFRWTQDNCRSFMAGYEILQGNYGLNNFTNGTPLWLQPFPGLSPVQCGLVGVPDTYAFKPLANENVIGGEYVGFWTDAQSSNGTAVYHPFVPGIYTVVAGDEWGQVAMLHFTVQG
jgi:hypothetical protein